jgi:hypothetical protein
MERDIPFYNRPRLEGRFVHASFGWGERGDVRFGGALLVVANPDGRTYSAFHRAFGPGENVDDEWLDLTREEAEGIAAGIGRSQDRAANSAIARDERAARRLLEDLQRTEFEASRARASLLTGDVPVEHRGGQPARGLRPPRG